MSETKKYASREQGFMYGMNRLRFNGKTLGWIEKGSFDWGGQKAETADIDAEQVQGAPVLILPQSNATIKPKFKLLQLVYETLKEVFGGKLLTKKDVDGKDVVVGWEAPSDVITISGAFDIQTPSGHQIDIYNAMLLGNIDGGLTLDAVSKIDCELGVMLPADGSSPYRIVNIEDAESTDNSASGDDAGNGKDGASGTAPASASVEAPEPGESETTETKSTAKK